MEPFQEGDPYPGQIKGKREMANKLPDPISPITTFDTHCFIPPSISRKTVG
jgi:hypothetical protein